MVYYQHSTFFLCFIFIFMPSRHDDVNSPRRWIVREFQGCAGKHLRWAKSYRCCEIKVWCRRKFFQKIPSYHSHGKWPYYRGKDRLVQTHSTISWRVFQLCWDHFFRDAMGVSSLRFFAVSLRKRSSITQRSLIVERKGLVSDEVIRPKDATVGVPSTRGMAKNAWEPQDVLKIASRDSFSLARGF